MTTTTIISGLLSRDPLVTFTDIYTLVWSQSSKIILAYILYVIYKYRNTALGVTPRSDLPGPRGWPLLGNTLYMLNRPKGKNLRIQTALHEKYGKVYTVTVVGFSRVINIRDPEMVGHVLRTNFWKYEKGEFSRTVLAPLIGGGIFGADGQHWKWQRKLASHIFTTQSLRNYTNTAFSQEAQIVVDYFHKITATTEDKSEIVDLQNIFLLFTLDTIGEVAFGQSFGCLKDPTQKVEFAVSFDRMNESLMRRFSLPFWRLNEWWTGMNKRIEEDTAVVNDFAYKLIMKRRQKSERQPKSEVAKADEVKDVESILHDLDVKTDKTPITPETPQMNQSKTIEDNEKETDLMQLFMDAIDDNGEPLSDEALKDILLNFILAGRDTTAQALSWMFYLILRSNSRKDILEKLISEIDDSLDDKNSFQDGTARPTYDSIKTQKYAEACFYETLRLYPSVPHNIRLCAEDDILPGGIPVYKGELVAWGIWAMGRDTAIWGPDAHEYRPERWLQGEKFSSAKFVSFHLGPRTCLGQQFATVEAIMITSMILRDFTLELIDPDTEPNYRSAITLPMADGLPVRIKPRCRTAAL